MKDILFMLAQNNPSAVPPSAGPTLPEPIAEFLARLQTDNLLDMVTNIGWLEAVVSIAFGAIYLSYGWRVFKTLVVINFAGIGMFAGLYLGRQMGSPLWGSVAGTCVATLFSLPFMKYCISILGGFAGTILCASLWRLINLPEEYLWCGALVGLIAGGLLVFSSFKISILFFTSLQGSMFVVIGALALVTNYPEFGLRFTDLVNQRVFILPTLLVMPTFMGMAFQQRLLKRESNWAMPE